MAARKKKPQKDITLAEFKAWLEGVEELQPASWAPDKEQWKLIRNKINCIVADVIEVEKEGPTQPQNLNPVFEARHQGYSQPHPAPQNIQPGPSMLDSYEPPNVEMTEAAQAALQGQTPPPTPAPSLTPDGKIQTPNIDSSDGYNSGFE